MIVATATHKQKVFLHSCWLFTAKDQFFFLLQSEVGDLYKVRLVYKDEIVADIDIQYFDTVPTATNLLITRTGYLFVAAEAGNQ